MVLIVMQVRILLEMVQLASFDTNSCLSGKAMISKGQLERQEPGMTADVACGLVMTGIDEALEGAHGGVGLAAAG